MHEKGYACVRYDIMLCGGGGRGGIKTTHS
jgi:hypothetical protein